jgi:hypothetical protein
MVSRFEVQQSESLRTDAGNTHGLHAIQKLMPTTLGSVETQLSQMIAQQETAGGTAGVGASLNNPGAVQFAQWEAAYGATPGAGGFAAFPTLDKGFAALNNLIDSYVKSGSSIQGMMNAYAPPALNPTTPSRIDALAAATGLNPQQPIQTQVQSGAATPATPTASGSTVTPTSNTPATGSTSAIDKVLEALGIEDASTGGFTWDRIVAGIVGIACMIVGLMMLKQTQIVVQNVQRAGKRVGKFAEAVSA